MFIASIVGSSRNRADTSGVAPIMSPDDVITWFGLRDASSRTSVAKRAAPPAGTKTSRPVASAVAPPSGARIGTVGASRLPWKSLNAISLTFSGVSTAGGAVAQPATTRAADSDATSRICIRIRYTVSPSATPASCAWRSAWYDDRTIAPTAACTKPIAYASRSNSANVSGWT